MDATRFDGLARILGSSSSRRSALRALAAVALGPRLTPDAVLGRKRDQKRKRQSNATSDKPHCNNRCHPCSPSRLHSGADLRGCDLSGQILTKRDLSGCNLSGACLQDAILRGTTLDGADLGGACLRKTILRETTLRGVSLANANLCGANLDGADLRGAKVSASQLACALVCNTRMPNGAVNNRDLGTSKACGGCDTPCAKEETCCGTSCANLTSDARHCARCGNECPPATANATVACGEAPGADGRLVRDCVYFCDNGWEDCDDDFDTGCEVFTKGDAENCGGCGIPCAAGLECCNCRCVPPGSGECGLCPTVTNARLIRRR